MQQEQSVTRQKLSPEDVALIVGQVQDQTPQPKEQVCEPKHTCDDDFDCKAEDFYCLDKHEIVDKKKQKGGLS